MEDSLYEWLPTYPNIDSTITIRQLLNHMSGIHDFADNSDCWDAIFSDPSRVWAPEELIQAFTLESVFPKGIDWNYSTTVNNLLRMIIMDITGSDLATVYESRFWQPLGLSSSFTLMDEGLPAGIAHGWFDRDNDGTYDDFYSWPRTAFATGIGGEIWSTPEDLAKWLKALIYDKTVVSEATLEQMLNFHAPCTGEEFMCAGYGLRVIKFNPETVDGIEAYGHCGDAPGYTVACIYLPDYQIFVGVMDNTEAGEAIGSCTYNLVRVIKEYMDDSP